jgi:hypothetical protein
MKKRSRALLVSIGVLGYLGLQGAIGIPAAFVPHDVGQFTRAVQISSGVSAIVWTLVWFGLAYAQWARRGAWGRGIGILALVVLGIQSFLTFLALSRGRIPLDASSIARFVFFTLVVFATLAVSSFVSHAEFRKNA